jgi:Transposase DDE domain
MAIIAATLARIKSDPLHCIGGKQRVNEHFAQAGHVWRKRRLDPATTLTLFILQVLHGNTAITHLRHLGRITVAAASYCQARARLPLEALAQLVEIVSCNAMQSPQSRDEGKSARGPTSWLGRRVILCDGTSVTTPDTAALQQRWPQNSMQKPGLGFPMIKLLGTLDLATGMILHLTMMSLNCHEMSQLLGLHAALQSGDVLLADRGFCSFVHLALLSVFPMDAVFRMHQKTIVDFTPGRRHAPRRGNKSKRGKPKSKFLRKLGQEDQIVEWIRPRIAPTWIDASLFAGLASTLMVRELRYRITVRGRRTRVVTIATTLLDPMRYPKQRIAELYGLRWEVETNFRHLKITMGMDRLKCKSIQGVLKELMIFVLVYNLVRAAMTLAAMRQRVSDPNRISFIDALRWLRERINYGGSAAAAALPGEPAIDLIVNRLRVGRWCPRVIKRRMKEYDLMTKPRRAYAEPPMEEQLAG